MHSRSVAPEPIDVLIVTILDTELGAVRRHVRGLVPESHVDDPIVYLRGSIPIERDSAGAAYSVVVIQLLGMGNPGAAVGVTTALRRFAPQATIVVGIAGGVPGELVLGDVAVSRDLVYYESGKQSEDLFEHRAPPVRAHPILAGQARSFGESDWHARITELRPGSRGAPSPSRVKVGTIGSGEKVVNSASFISALKKQYKSLIAVAMEGSGSATPAIYFGAKAGDILEIRGISDLADGTKDDDWQSYAADAAAAFMTAFLATGPILSRAAEAASRNSIALQFAAIRAQSMAAVNPADVAAVLRKAGATEVTDIAVDLLAYAGNAGRLRDPGGAVRAMAADEGPLMQALAVSELGHLAFYGHLHVPLAVLAGALATDRVPARVFDYRRNANPPTWAWPVSDDRPYPPLRTTVSTQAQYAAFDAVIRVGISYAIDRELTDIILPHPSMAYDLYADNPMIDIVSSEVQARAYARQVRRTLDVLAAAKPRPARIHMFYAGPVSVAFLIGQTISPTIHSCVLVWNHRAGVYDWGLNLTSAIDGEDAIVRPSDLRSEGGR